MREPAHSMKGLSFLQWSVVLAIFIGGRGKDPKDEEEIEVLCFGRNARTVKAMLNFNIATPKIGKHW